MDNRRLPMLTSRCPARAGHAAPTTARSKRRKIIGNHFIAEPVALLDLVEPSLVSHSRKANLSEGHLCGARRAPRRAISE
jgi:hypothetical protein